MSDQQDEYGDPQDFTYEESMVNAVPTSPAGPTPDPKEQVTQIILRKLAKLDDRPVNYAVEEIFAVCRAALSGAGTRDTQRLDWLEQDHNATVRPTMLDGDFGVLVESENGMGFSLNGKVREAIDAAMSRYGRSRAPSVPATRTGRCAEKARVGGCQLPNVQCNYPKCDEWPEGEVSRG